MPLAAPLSPIAARLTKPVATACAKNVPMAASAMPASTKGKLSLSISGKLSRATPKPSQFVDGGWPHPALAEIGENLAPPVVKCVEIVLAADIGREARGQRRAVEREHQHRQAFVQRDVDPADCFLDRHPFGGQRDPLEQADPRECSAQLRHPPHHRIEPMAKLAQQAPVDRGQRQLDQPAGAVEPPWQQRMLAEVGSAAARVVKP